jgi:hypothetical protein
MRAILEGAQARQQFSSKARTIVIFFCVVAFVCASAPFSLAQQRSLGDWQLLLDHLRQQLEQDSKDYPRQSGTDTYKNSCNPYVEALQVFAKDRDEAFKAAQEAQASKDPKVKALFDQFMDLVDRAQDEGNATLHLADILLRVEDNYGPIDGATLSLRAGTYGKCVYDKARELKFDYSITRGQVQRMLDKALDDLDTGWSLRCEETPGNPEYCGWMYPDKARDPDPYDYEILLAEADKVRELSPYFDLGAERQRADELMNRYLKDTLCLDPNAGHKRYLELADKYGLSSAKDYIDGFYATLKGTVHLEEGGGQQPAQGAHVTVTDPKDQTKWEADTGADGSYTIKKALLHADRDEKGRPRCPHFSISATWQNCRADDTYTGPLIKPNSSEVLKKDVTMTCVRQRAAKGTFTIRRQVTTHRVSNDPKHSSLEEGTSVANATIVASFEFERLYAPRDKDEVEEAYAVKSWDILDASANDYDKQEDEWRDPRYARGIKERTVKLETASWKVGKSDIGPEGLSIFFDKRTGKATRVLLNFHGLMFSGQSHIKTDSVYGDKGYDRHCDCYSSFRYASSSDFQPPMEAIGVPVLTNNLTASPAEAIQSGGMAEGTRVTGGDRVHQLSGGGTVKFPETIPGKTQEYTFNWQITRVPPTQK